MTARQEELLRFAVGYLRKHRKEAIDEFEFVNDDAYGCIISDGEIMPEPEEKELDELFYQLTWGGL